MALWIEKKYINMAAQNLGMFTWKSERLANFRCPFCGDSEKKKYKARGYFFEKKGTFIYHCHNCSEGRTLASFLRELNPPLYRQYTMEKFAKPVANTITGKVDMSSLDNNQPISSINLPKITELGSKHEAVDYLIKRKIPLPYLADIYYAEDFKKFCDQLIPNHGKKLIENDPRIVIPFRDMDNRIVGVTGRSLDPYSDLRYIIMNMDDTASKIFGLNRHNPNKKTYVTEGPFDSMFLDNALAAAGANLLEVLPNIKKDTTTFIFDNEPRNPNIIKAMKKVIKLGCKIFIWPEAEKNKDINDFILAGNTPSEAMALIDNNTLAGLQATIKLQNWSKT